MGSGNVTTRGHDAPVVSADDHWNIAQLRPVAFLYGGVESVAVEMGDGEAMKLICQEELYNPGRDVSINPNENSILTPQRPGP